MAFRAQEAEEFRVSGMAERLAPYEVSRFNPLSVSEAAEDDLVERAVTLLTVMPCNQHRETVENLLSPNDPQRGRRAVDALIDAALATEDEQGRLHQTV